jgi:threonine/homoserine/homoserine lactone efflux protein
MPEAAHLITFALASLALAITPGPDLIYVMVRGAAQGPLAGIVAALGLATGILGHTLLCIIGLSALLMASATAFTVVKWLGAAYLIYIGVQMWRHAGKLDFGAPPPPKPLIDIYRQTIVMNLLNPKVALFFLAFLPHFVDPAGGPAWMQFGVLGLIFLGIGLCVMGTAGVAGGMLRRWLATTSRRGALLERFAGAVIIALGIGVALQQRN